MTKEKTTVRSITRWSLIMLALAALLFIVYKGATFDAEAAISSTGVLAVALIAFIETGFLIGTVLPGDSLLLTAGILASQDIMPIIPLIVAVTIAGALAYNIAYSIGRQAGTRLFKKEDGILFRKSHVTSAQKFYDRYGAKSLVIARFVPMIRSFAPLLAGVAKMPRKQFMLYNCVSSALWSTSIILLGYWLGGRIPGLEDYLKYFIILSVIVAFGMMAGQLLHDNKSRELLLLKAKDYWRLIRLNKKMD